VATGGDEVRVDVVGISEQQESVGEEQEMPPVLVLRGGERELHVPIGSCEGLAILLALQQQVAPRPLTHDLGIRILEKLSASVERAVIDGLSNDVYYSTLYLSAQQGAISVPARPGDAVALALRAEVPIFVTEDVFARAGRNGEPF
jgi:bifunctional DNase/RNase